MFTHFIEQYIQTLNILIKYQGSKISFQWINNFLRIFLVFFARLYYDLKKSTILLKNTNERLNKYVPDFIYITL